MNDADDRSERRFFWFVVVPALVICLGVFVLLGWFPEALSCEGMALIQA